MKVLVSGSTGLIGSALIPSLEAEGHTVKRLVRKEAKSDNEIFWNPTSKTDSSKLDGFDGVVQLAGESIIGRWNQEKKAKIRNSRNEGTKSLVDALISVSNPPKILVCASAIGYYGDRGNELLKEDSAPGTGF